MVLIFRASYQCTRFWGGVLRVTLLTTIWYNSNKTHCAPVFMMILFSLRLRNVVVVPNSRIYICAKCKIIGACVRKGVCNNTTPSICIAQHVPIELRAKNIRFPLPCVMTEMRKEITARRLVAGCLVDVCTV